METGLRFKTALFILGVFLMAPSVMAKRVAATVIQPIEKDGVVYTPRFVHEKSGYAVSIVAQNTQTGSPFWETKLYDRHFNLEMETDVQEIRLKSLTLENGELRALDEGGKTYKMNATSGKLVQPTEPFHYPTKGD